MIRFSVRKSETENIFLDMTADVSLSFKKTNPAFKFGEMETGRSAEFDIPLTARNRLLLDYPDDPSELGLMLRRRHPSQMVFSGGVVNGSIALTAVEGNSVKAVFYYDDAEDLQRINGKKLSDCKVTLAPVRWAKASGGGTIYQANAASIPAVALVEYAGEYLEQQATANWVYLPSVELDSLVNDILGGLDVRYDFVINKKHRLITNTIKASVGYTGTIAKTGMEAGTIDAVLQDFFEFDEDDFLYYSKNWGATIGQRPDCWSIRARKTCEVTFPSTFPDNYSLWYNGGILGAKWQPVTDRYMVHPHASEGYYVGQPLAGRTVTLQGGQRFFIVDEEDFGVNGADEYGYGYGWMNDASPWSFSLQVKRAGDNIVLGEMWDAAVNLPDMTVAELVRAAAVVEGCYVRWDEGAKKLEAVDMDAEPPYVYELKDVISIDSVKRNVSEWGDDVGEAVVRFDDEDYVTSRHEDIYKVDNDELQGELEVKIPFNEGELQDDGSVFVDDVEFNGNDGKPKAKKVTIADAGGGKLLVHCAVVRQTLAEQAAIASTCVSVKARMDIADFASLTDDYKVLLRGRHYLWSSASWTAGVATLTLQAL